MARRSGAKALFCRVRQWRSKASQRRCKVGRSTAKLCGGKAMWRRAPMRSGRESPRSCCVKLSKGVAVSSYETPWNSPVMHREGTVTDGDALSRHSVALWRRGWACHGGVRRCFAKAMQCSVVAMLSEAKQLAAKEGHHYAMQWICATLLCVGLAQQRFATAM